ncbi:MAG: hypothetical protein JO199_01785, partial [Candidatus Eremiobacteraeota bacterium]|nr:hypothetical protein [Candidatus Eremiobacteraeota bacterium]
MKQFRIVSLTAVAIALAACSGATSQSSSSASSAAPAGSAPSGPKTIGVSIQNREAQFYQDMEAGMKAE